MMFFYEFCLRCSSVEAEGFHVSELKMKKARGLPPVGSG